MSINYKYNLIVFERNISLEINEIVRERVRYRK